MSNKSKNLLYPHLVEEVKARVNDADLLEGIPDDWKPAAILSRLAVFDVLDKRGIDPVKNKYLGTLLEEVAENNLPNHSLDPKE
jgi:hypothetical protein